MPQRARIVQPTNANLDEAARLLLAGELVAMPTETVYGLAGVAFDEQAVTRIFQTKERPIFDPLIVHVAPSDLTGLPHELADQPLGPLEKSGLLRLELLGAKGRACADALARAFWPGPLTLVLPRGARVPDLVTSGLATVAVRHPRHPVAEALIRRVGLPLAAPSANRFGRISPTSADDVASELGDRIALILDGGRADVGVESTVVRVSPEGAATILRPGGVTREALEAVVGSVAAVEVRGDAKQAHAAPGMLDSHYAPARPLLLLAGPAAWVRADQIPAGKGPIGLLVAVGDSAKVARDLERATRRRVIARTLSESGNPVEAARHLFALLRELDESGATLLLAEPWPDSRGLGYAIQDRLRRAAAKR